MQDRSPKHIPKIHVFVPILFQAAIKSAIAVATPNKYNVITIYILSFHIIHELEHLYRLCVLEIQLALQD